MISHYIKEDTDNWRGIQSVEEGADEERKDIIVRFGGETKLLRSIKFAFMVKSLGRSTSPVFQAFSSYS